MSLKNFDSRTFGITFVIDNKFEIDQVKTQIVGYGSRTAIMWEGNEPGDSCSYTFQDLFNKVVTFSAVLRSHGVKKVSEVQLVLLQTVSLMEIKIKKKTEQARCFQFTTKACSRDKNEVFRVKIQYCLLQISIDKYYKEQVTTLL